VAIERTLSIIKPDALEKGVVGRIVSRFETSGLKPIAMRLTHLSRREAEGFYAEHKGKPFFEGLVGFMTRGPSVIMVLEGEDAIAQNRKVMGATNPAKADPGTLRKDFATDMTENSVHGSDSPTSAAREIGYFFAQTQVAAYEWKNKR
jgi:nucleoside-diphosphate kinase